MSCSYRVAALLYCLERVYGVLIGFSNWRRSEKNVHFACQFVEDGPFTRSNLERARRESALIVLTLMKHRSVCTFSSEFMLIHQVAIARLDLGTRLYQP